jgi:hypothetical protein
MTKEQFSYAIWELAKEQALGVMVQSAYIKDVVSYSTLVHNITAIKFDLEDVSNRVVLSQLLGEISIEEDKVGRGMLSAVVVHKHGDKVPGMGFYELASKLGRDTSDPTACWVNELNFVYNKNQLRG